MLHMWVSGSLYPPPGSGKPGDAVAGDAEVVAEDAATAVGGSRPSDKLSVHLHSRR